MRDARAAVSRRRAADPDEPALPVFAHLGDDRDLPDVVGDQLRNVEDLAALVHPRAG